MRSNATLVGVIDSGINVHHPGVDGLVVDTYIAQSIRDSGVDFVEDRGHLYHGTVTAQILVRHNPHVGLLIARASGHGGASNVFAPQDLFDATRWAVAAGARVVNYSLGPLFMVGAPNVIFNWFGHTDDMHALNHEQSVVSVLAAGNRGQSITQDLLPTTGFRFGSLFAKPWSENVLVVGAINQDGSLQEYSSFPGADERVQARFLVVPTPVVVLSRDSTQERYILELTSGTSAAAPQVAAAASHLISHWPHLSAQHTSEILLRSADRSFSNLYLRNDCGERENINCGAYFFGMGKLDVQAAMLPVGGLRTYFHGAERLGALRLGSAFGDARASHIPGLALDDFDRGYALNLSSLLQNQDWQDGAGSAKWVHQAFFSQVQQRRAKLGRWHVVREGASMRLHHFDRVGGNLSWLHLLRREHERLPMSDWDDPGLLADSGSHLGVFDDAMMFGAEVGQRVRLKAQIGYARTQSRYAMRSRALEQRLALGWNASRETCVEIGLDAVQEQGGLQGVRGSGAFAPEHSRSHTWVLHLRRNVGSHWRFFGILRQGKMHAQGRHLVQSIHANTSAFALGLLHQRAEYRHVFAITQPMRADRAHLVTKSAKGLDAQGRMSHAESSSKLAPSARTLSLEWRMTQRLLNGGTLDASIVHVLRPGHSAQAGAQTFAGLMYRASW